MVSGLPPMVMPLAAVCIQDADGGDCAGRAVKPIGVQGVAGQQAVGSSEACQVDPAAPCSDGVCRFKWWLGDGWQCASFAGIRGPRTPDELHMLIMVLQQWLDAVPIPWAMNQKIAIAMAVRVIW